MAMDALKNLTNNIPDWQRRLEELSGQINKRQVELAALAEAKPKTRSLRNKGSTESLKPTDDGPMHICLDEEPTQQPVAVSPIQNALEKQPSPPSPINPTAAQGTSPPRRILTPRLAHHSQAAKKRQRTSSISSGDGPRPAQRTRSMIIVYYDSYVQGFFDDMVRFISSSRNLMRKAKMAAKVAQIKRLAEMDLPDDENTSGDDRPMPETLPSLRLMSSRRYGPGSMRFGPPGARNSTPDVYDELDRALEFVQSTCEHGAHQFLRDANCNEEIKKIKKRVAEVLEMAIKEAERVEREEPELAKESGDLHKPRTRRPITMSRNLVAGHKDNGNPASDNPMKLEVADSIRGPPLLPDHIEVDPHAKSDESLDANIVLQKLQYRSTRHMRIAAE
ncbi:hypothetical protein PT974_00629 [Cladobotryum mycophilum]|uniref:Uncharacterized protein n=1 Tax=Cladobotryum mycophilum TaxID=491253 RepID=A0ABR0T2N6_9HYPO